VGDVALILLVSSLLGALARSLGQPRVIGQIVTGILLGPTFLGRMPGNLTHHLFPHQILPFLTVLSQVAIVIFMFVVGYEIDFRPLRGSSGSMPLVAGSALVVPMVLGAGSVLLLPSAYTAAGEQHVGSRSFVLFMGVATSVTALPVLAAIVRERGVAGTRAGIVATTAAGVMDVTAWLVLAAAIAGSSHAAKRPLVVTALLLAALVAVVFLIVRPVLRTWIQRPSALLSHQLPIALVLGMGTAWATSWLGLHVVFGGFLAGLAMPSRDGSPDADVLQAMEGAANLLLPLFFVVTGLSLNLGSLRWSDLALLALILLIAGAGKLGPAYLAGRLGGLERRTAATVAALLNTRGLTELIALNIGLTAGIIHERLFVVLVLMALITTMMTSPLLTLIGPSDQPATPREPQPVVTEQPTGVADI
jgi:Kef-type K+ transport system membrane component KefB